MTNLPAGAVALSPAAVRVLNALDFVYRRDGRATTRSVMRAVGLRSPSTVSVHLHNLRALGLVTWEPGVDGSLRPAVDRVDVDRGAA